MLPVFFDDFRTLETAMSDASDKITDVSTRAVTDARALGLMSEIAMLVASLLAVGTVIVIVIGARRQVVKPIVDITAAMDKLAAGDTSVQAPHAKREDEIGRMAAALSKFRENAVNRNALEASQRTQEAERAARSRRVEALASGFADQLAASLSTLRQSSNRLLGDASSLEQVCDEANHSARNAIDATAGANANVQTIAAATTQLSASIQEIATRMSESARSAEMAASQGAAAGATAQQLADSARNIDEIVSVIGSVAEQTNLLALNATIEAARAGEAGRGFAVVANEVKELANATARATDEIGRKIEAIQNDSNGAREAITRIATVVQNISEIQTAIATSVEEQTRTTNEIARSLAEAAGGSQEIVQNVAQVSTAASDTSREAETTIAAAEDLARVAQELEGLVQRFRT